MLNVAAEWLQDAALVCLALAVLSLSRAVKRMRR